MRAGLRRRALRSGGRAPWAIAISMVLLSCDDTPRPSGDSGIDAALDASIEHDGGPPDGGPVCEPICEGVRACCPTPSGEPACSTLVDDLANCGRCGLHCLDTGRGDACRSSQCACGDFDLGCLGRFTSTCCVPPSGAGLPHCANLAQSFDDCGACGRACDPAQANDCDGGRCICGDDVDGCAGTPEDSCCADLTDTFSCVDTTRDRLHCGECGNRCSVGMRCELGACVL
jgi:hypothetical protein